MQLEKGSLDLVLVPCGLMIMFSYHLLLLYPGTTVIGYENHNKLAWVRRMVQASPDETGLALSVISSNISASTNLASLSIALGSLIGAWVSSTTKVFMTELVYGDRSQSTATVKYISLLVCFLASFTCFIHSARYYVQASFLITTLDSDVPRRHPGRQLLVHGAPGSLLRHYAAHVDLRADSDVRLLRADGGHPAHAGQQLPAPARTPVHS